MKTKEDFVSASLTQWIKLNYHSVQDISKDSLPMIDIDSFFKYLHQIPDFPTSEFSLVLAGFGADEKKLKQKAKKVGLNLQDIADDFYTAAAWRNDKENHNRIIALAHAQQPGVHTLNHFTHPSSRELAICVLEWALESKECKYFVITGAHQELLKTLKSSHKLKDLRSLDTLCIFLARWSELSAKYQNKAPIEALPELGLLADPDLFLNLKGIEERLVRNFQLIKQIIEERKSALTSRRKRFANEKNEKRRMEYLDILDRIENLRLNPSSQNRNNLSLKDVEKIFKPTTDRKDPHPRPKITLDTKNINRHSAEALLDNREDDLINALDNLRRKWDETIESDGESTEGEISFKNENWDYRIESDTNFLDWLHAFCKDDIWGGSIHSKEPSLELAIKNYNNAIGTPQYLSVDNIFPLGGKKISLNEVFERFDNDLIEKKFLSEPITPDWIRFRELRREILKDLDYIVKFPLLWVSTEPDLCTKVEEYINLSGKIYTFVHSHYQEMQEISSDYANIILGGLLKIDIFLVHVHTDSIETHKAIMLPTHPLHLWRFFRLSSLLRGFGDQIKPQDRKAILDDVMRPEHFLNVICLGLIPDSQYPQGIDLTLPLTNEINGLATFENLSNAISGADGIIELSDAIDRFVMLGRHHTYPLRIAIINPPEPGKIMMKMVEVLNNRRESILKKMRVEIFCTLMHKQRCDLSLRLLEEREELEEKISNGRIEYKVNQKIFNSLEDVLTSIKKTPFHIIAIFDESSITIQKSTQEKILPMSPFTVRYDIKYDHYGAKITLEPKNCESPFSEYMILINEALNIQRNQTLFASSDATIMVNKIDEMLNQENPLAHWVFFADRALPNYSNMKSVRLLERIEGRRKVLLASSDYHQFSHRIMEVFNNSNLSMNELKIEILLSEGIGLIGGGFFNIIKKDGNVDSKQALGLAGMLIASRDYRRRHPESLLVSVDDRISRLWLRMDPESSDRCDLLALRIENASFIVESIEVKTRSSDDVEEIGRVHAQEQIIATLDACSAAIPDNLLGEERLSAPRCEMLKRIFVHALQSQKLPSDHRKFWVKQLKNIFDDENHEIPLKYSGELISVLIGCNSPPEQDETVIDTKYPISIKYLIEGQIQDLIDGGTPAILSPDRDSIQEKPSIKKDKKIEEKKPEMKIKIKRATIIEEKMEPGKEGKKPEKPEQKNALIPEIGEVKNEEIDTNWPPKLNKFNRIGQYQQVEELIYQVNFSKKAGKKFPDKLLVGPAGVGKSTLARKIAEILEQDEILLNGADLRNPSMIIDRLQENGFVPSNPSGLVKVNKCLIFIDEVHAIGNNVATVLLSAMDDSRITTIDGISYDFNKVIIILATTDAGKLSEAFRSRPDQTYLSPFTLDEIAGMIWLRGKELLNNEELARDVCYEIAARTQGTPRIALRKLEFNIIPYVDSISPENQTSIDYKKLANAISIDLIVKWFESQKIDLNGLGEKEYNFLRYLKKNGATSQSSLQHGLGISNNQDFAEIDEYLRRLGLIEISHGGRILKKEGRSYLEKPIDLRDRISRQTS